MLLPLPLARGILRWVSHPTLTLIVSPESLFLVKSVYNMTSGASSTSHKIILTQEHKIITYWHVEFKTIVSNAPNVPIAVLDFHSLQNKLFKPKF
jgi:hypothetical protein